MSIQKAEMSIEQIENGQIVEHVAYPYVEYEHVTMENGMDIMSMIRDDVSTPTVTHDATSWRVGQGDGDVSKSIVDSSVASMTIKGQTYQNILPSPSLRNSMTNGKTMQKLNEGYDSVSTVDGVCKSAILSGQTLVNLMVDYQEEKLVRYGNPPETPNVANMTMLKPNTEYTLFYKAKYQNDGDVGKLLFRFAIDGSTIRDMSVDGTNPYTTTYQQYVHKFTTPSTIDYFIFRSNGNYFLVKECVLLEGDYTNVDIPYFEGMQSVKLPVLTTTGKNLFDKSKIKKGYAISSSNPTTESVYAVRDYMDYIEVESGATYKLSNCTTTAIFGYKNKGDYYGYVSLNGINAIPHDVKYIRFNIDNSFNYSNAQLEKNTVATSYEPYKTNILTVNEPIELRGIGDVKDELNLLTGEVVENTIKLTFSGIENWETSANLTNYMTFRLAKPSNMITADSHSNASKYVCDKLQIVSSNTVGSTEIEAIWFSTGHMYIRLPKTKASSLEEFKTYLSTNNIQVVSCAKQPVVKTVDLSILDQDNQPTTQLNSFANGYIQVSSQGLIPSVDYEVPTSNSYYVDLMKANTQYTMKNMQGTFTIDGIQYNANANGTFTSPSALTNNFMITSVAQSQPMLLEGDVREKDIPYFKGIKSAFEDESKIEVLSTGKNLFDKNTIPQMGVEYKDFTKAYATTIEPILKLKPNTLYQISGEVTQIPNRNSIFKFVDNNGVEIQGTYVSMNNTNGNEPKTIVIKNKFTTGNNGEIYFNTFPAYTQEDLDKLKNILNSSKIQIEESSTQTSYEPYKSNSTKIPLLSPLRSLPNGVRDEIVLDRMSNKAKLIQRVGSVVLDGSFGVPSQTLGGYFISYYGVSDVKKVNGGNVYCDKFKSHGQIWAGGQEGVSTFSNSTIWLSIYSKKLEASNIDGMKKWLSQNPVTVYYELETPIVTEVNLEGYPYVYKDGHIFLNTEIAPATEATYSINQAHQIESSNEDILRHQNEINHLYELIAQYVQVQYEAELIDIALQG